MQRTKPLQSLERVSCQLQRGPSGRPVRPSERWVCTFAGDDQGGPRRDYSHGPTLLEAMEAALRRVRGGGGFPYRRVNRRR